jgi:uncharacterized protein (TIGR02594 family)
MRKIILAALLAVPFIFTSVAYAEPVNKQTTEQTVKKPVKKKKVKKQKEAVKVEDKLNAFLRDCGLFGCASPTYTSFAAPISDENAGAYWAREYEREQIRKKQIAKAPPAPKQPAKKEKECTGFFTVCDRDSGPYIEAKRWEGKTATGNRQELKALLAQGNNNIPVDPARIPWCAAFANAILNRQGYETTGSLTARSFLTLNHKTKDPEIGDIVITKRGHSNATGHVGFFEGFEEVDGVKYVKVFGGNTQKAVSTGWFPVNAVLGYRKVA